MSFEKNYGNHYPFDNDYEEETIFTKEEILAMQIENHLAEEEFELEEIKEMDRCVNEK